MNYQKKRIHKNQRKNYKETKLRAKNCICEKGVYENTQDK